MSATVQDAILLFGDSITQAGWQPGGFASQLARKSIDISVYMISTGQ